MGQALSWKRTRKEGQCFHHIRNRVDGGTNLDANLLLLWREKERQFHDLFGSRTLYQAAKLLLRVHRAKQRQRQKAA